MSIADAFAPKPQSPFAVENLQSQIESLQAIQQARQNISNGQKQQQVKSNVKAVNIDRLSEFCKNMPQEKVEWTVKQPNVSEKLQTMKNAFIDYLFDSYVVDFDKHCEEHGLPYVKNYVDSFMQNADGYVSQYDKQSQEIADLKEQIAKLSKSGGDKL